MWRLEAHTLAVADSYTLPRASESIVWGGREIMMEANNFPAQRGKRAITHPFVQGCVMEIGSIAFLLTC